MTTVHSHRPTTKLGHKPFKSRKATKGRLRDVAKGRIEKSVHGIRTQHAMSKLERKNQAKQRQLSKAREHQKENSIFSGRDGAPRIVVVVPLCADADAPPAIQKLLGSLDIDAEVRDSPFRVTVDRFKQKLQYVPVERNLSACLDAARVADFVVVILSATTPVDPLGELILRSVESQGLSTFFTAVHGLENIESVKQRQGVLTSLKSYITHFHPDQEKLFSLDNRQECSNLMRALCSTTPKGVCWREDRSWMLVEEVRFPSGAAGSAVLTGVVRGKGMKADRLVQLGDVGTFRIEKITEAPLPRVHKINDGMAVDDEEPEAAVLDTPGEDGDDLADLAPEALVADDDDMASVTIAKPRGVLLDEHHYFSDEEEEADEEVVRKRVPRGTSKYQSAWFLGGHDGDVVGGSEDGSDYEDMAMADAAEADAPAPQDGLEGLVAPTEVMDTTPSEYPQSEMFAEPTADDDAEQLAAFRSRKQDAAEDDKEFPDEIELHPNVLARERLARYRGLKSLRTSTWAEEEDRPHEPEDWRRLLRIPDYHGARSRSAKEALVGGVPAGTRVHVHLRGVPADFRHAYGPRQPVTLFSLLRHEHKQTVVNHLIALSSDYPTSIKAKEEFIVQCGPRRFVANPIFSQPGATPNDVHKSCRFLHPGQTAVATFIGPVTWGSVPTLFFKKTSGGEVNENGDPAPGLNLVATGTALAPSTSRVIVKRVILTGHPYHMHKKSVTIRYMFFNREDVNWFKALPLWTRRGRSGHIREAIGTHGYFKAAFDGRINPQDAIGVSLYKRLFPRRSQPFRGGLLLEGVRENQGPEGEDTVMEDIL